MTRDEAVEAGARALDPNAWDDALWRLMGGGTAQEVRQAEARSDVAAVLDVIGWRPEAEVKAEAIDRAIKFLADGAYPPIVDRGDPRAGMLARLRAWDGAE